MRWQYRTTVLGLCLLAFFVTYFARMAISPIVPFIVADFAVSNTAIGVALTGMWLAYGLSQFPSGVLSDRYGEKPVILVAVGGTVIASVLLAFSPVFAAFVVFAVLLGSVAGLHYAVATTLLSRTYDELGRAVGIHSIGGPLAGLVAPVAAAWVASGSAGGRRSRSPSSSGSRSSRCLPGGSGRPNHGGRISRCGSGSNSPPCST